MPGQRPPSVRRLFPAGEFCVRGVAFVCVGPEGIRTPDLAVKSRLLYRAELRAHDGSSGPGGPA
jgi:hypothetical protein